MGSSRRDLWNEMAERRPSLKNNRNTYYPRFLYTPKTRIPKNGVLFLLCNLTVNLRCRLLPAVTVTENKRVSSSLVKAERKGSEARYKIPKLD